jgi:hypothetical protein
VTGGAFFRGIEVQPNAEENEDSNTDATSEKDFEIYGGVYKKPRTAEIGITDTGHYNEENAGKEKKDAAAGGDD